jgi:DNA mismatch repair protein MutL
MAIRKLDPLLVNQIAAGEVIERPASVVKELVENSLDAGAGRIAVQIEQGGCELIRVSDDGSGIPIDQLAMALEPHATSKLAAPEDLAAIHTMGFRGEALASIASVSRLGLISRSQHDDSGALVEAEGGPCRSPRPHAAAIGTTVEVRNLFFNTPARRKFLRTAATESSHVQETLSRLAMAHPQVGFTLEHNGRSALDLPPTDRRRRCLAIMGDSLADAMLEFEQNERSVELWGLAGQPSLARTTTRYQYLFVNGRPIRDRHVAHAIREAYRGLIEPARQPVIVLFIDLPADQVDVNVHPTKSEVRFVDGNLIHGQVLAAVRQCLLGADLTPHVDPDRAHQSTIRFDDLVGSLGSGADRSSTDRSGDAPLLQDNSTGGEPVEAQVQREPVQAFVEFFRRLDPRQKGFAYEQVRREIHGDDAADAGSDSHEAHAITPPPTRSCSIIQVHDSYVVTEDETGLVIIDQHALHERMMFEMLQQRLAQSGQLESQRLLTPVTFEASSSQMQALEQLSELMQRLGIEADAIGPHAVAIHSFPTLLFDRGVEPAEFLQSLLDRAVEDGLNPSDEAALHEVLDMMACKAAVKAGQRLSEEELAELLRRREQIERASNCPHGRPTSVRLTMRDLERHFKRT